MYSWVDITNDLIVVSIQYKTNYLQNSKHNGITRKLFFARCGWILLRGENLLFSFSLHKLQPQAKNIFSIHTPHTKSPSLGFGSVHLLPVKDRSRVMYALFPQLPTLNIHFTTLQKSLPYAHLSFTWNTEWKTHAQYYKLYCNNICSINKIKFKLQNKLIIFNNCITYINGCICSKYALEFLE